jgi:photosystem II stability/assembly factor-like uncharacterized protein
MFRTYIGAESGAFRLIGDQLQALGLAEHTISAIHAWAGPDGPGTANDTVLAGTYGEGILRSTDGGATWQAANAGLTAPALRTFLLDPTQLHATSALLGGAEPGRGFRTTDRGQSWQELGGIAAVPGSDDWYLPYSPRAGALRNFYSPPGHPDKLFASIEVGGLLYSEDGGTTWARLNTYDDDIHYVTGHPQRADEIWLALGWAAMQDRDDVDRGKLGGVARSDDGGQSWTKQIDHDYTRAVLIPPTHPNLVLAGPAKQVGRQGSIVVSDDSGATWQPAGDGLEDPMSDMVEQFVSAPDGSIWAICSGGRLLRAEPDMWRWRSVLPASADAIQVQSVSFVTGT